MEKVESRGSSEIGGGDSKPLFKLLLSCPSGLSQSQVSVVCDESYDRIPDPDINLEKSISEIWEQRVERSPSLFNGSKFRYAGHNFHNGVGNQVPHLCLHLGLTDYRTFVGTNLNPLWERFLAQSEDDFVRCQHTSNPLGNGAIVETSDKRILLLQRSNNVGEFPGHFVFPGGHPEPEEVGLITHQFDKDLRSSELINEKLSLEMFDSIIREVVEEIGVPAESLSKEIQQLYSSAQDGYESTQLYTVAMNDLESMAAKMPGCHRGGFALYKLMIEAQKVS